MKNLKDSKTRPYGHLSLKVQDIKKLRWVFDITAPITAFMSKT